MPTGTITPEILARLAALAPARPVHHPSRQSTADSAASHAAGSIPARIRNYLAAIPGAVSGERGHDRTFRAACKLVCGFALTPDAAFHYLAEWNLKCSPPWSEHDLRKKLADADKRSGPRGSLLLKDSPPPGASNASSSSTSASAAAFRNFTWDEISDGETTRKVRRGRRGVELVEELLNYTGGWPRRVGEMLFARGRDGNIVWMKRTSELFAWIDWQYSFEAGRGYDWAAGSDCLSQEAFLSSCRQHCEHWEQVELYPHEPPLPNHFYHHPEVNAAPEYADGSTLTDLVRRFFPATPEDEDLIRLFFLTLIWGGPPRKRPIFLFEAAKDARQGGRGAGKTTVPVIGGQLVGGFVTISPREHLRDIQTRLLSPEALTRRIALIDNLKSLRFSDSDIESLVTSPVISGRQLHTGEGRRPNTLCWIVTSNSPSLSKDLAQRSVIVRVMTPVYTPEWERDVTSFINANRWKIIGDCIAELRKPTSLPNDFEFSRWAEWEADILSKAADPITLASELVSRQKQVDDDDEITANITDAIREMLQRFNFDPERDVVLIPSRVLFEEVVKKAGKGINDLSSGMRWLYMLGVKCLSKFDASLPYRGGVWRPEKASAEARMQTWAGRTGASGIPE